MNFTKYHNTAGFGYMYSESHEAESKSKVNLLITSCDKCKIARDNHPLSFNACCVAVHKPSDPVCEDRF